MGTAQTPQEVLKTTFKQHVATDGGSQSLAREWKNVFDGIKSAEKKGLITPETARFLRGMLGLGVGTERYLSRENVLAVLEIIEPSPSGNPLRDLANNVQRAVGDPLPSLIGVMSRAKYIETVLLQGGGLAELKRAPPDSIKAWRFREQQKGGTANPGASSQQPKPSDWSGLLQHFKYPVAAHFIQEWSSRGCQEYKLTPEVTRLMPAFVAAMYGRETIFGGLRNQTSSAGAVGPLQVLPSTGTEIAKDHKTLLNTHAKGPGERDFAIGILYLCKMVSEAQNQLENIGKGGRDTEAQPINPNLLLELAAIGYNAGPPVMHRYIDNIDSFVKNPESNHGQLLPRETRNYLATISCFLSPTKTNKPTSKLDCLKTKKQ